MKILIIDDDPSLRASLRDILKAKGFEAIPAETGGTALAQIEQREIDVALIDLRLEDMPGLDVLRGIKTRSPGTECIMLTGHASQASAIEAINLGAYSYFQKPYDVEQLLVAIRRAAEKRAAGEALRESEERFHSLYENATIGIYRTTPDGKILLANPALVDILGYSSFAELSQRDLEKEGYEPGYERSIFRQKIESGGVIKALESAWTKRDGTIIFVRESAKAISDAEGKVIYYEGIVEDITERKRAEDALRESEKKYQGLIEISPVGVFKTDAQGITTYVNPRWSQISGLPAEEALGDGWLRAVPLEDRERVSANWKKAADAQIASMAEYRFVRPDGSIVWVLGQATPEWNVHNQIVGYVGTITDITELKETQKKLADSELELRVLFASMKDVVLVIDRDGVYRKIAPTNQSLLVRPADELLGKNLQDVFPLEQAEAFCEVMKQVLNTKRTDQVEYKLIIGSQTVWFETSISPMTEDSTLWVAHDITKRKQTEEAIHQRVAELEVLYESGLALGRLLSPKEIGQKIIELLEQKLDWHHTTIRLYHPQGERLELLAFNQPGLKSKAEKRAVEERFNMEISKLGDGLTGWAVKQDRAIRVGDVSNDPHYKDTFPGLHSGLYIPIKAGERILGVISIESEQPNAFSEADERLVSTLANQAASALENARLFEEAQLRVANLETLNRISITQRAISKQDEMLAIVLEETLSALNASHGSINLWNDATEDLQRAIARGWLSEVTESPIKPGEGIFGKVYASGEMYITRDFVNDPLTRPETRGQLPPGWGGACVPIRSIEQTLGVLVIAISGERELEKDEIRLLTTIAEMTGAALHRMRLHDETARRLDNLQALHAVDRAIASSFNLSPILETVLTYVISQLGVDAADVLLFHPHLQTLEYAAGQGFHTNIAKSTNIRLGHDFAGRVALERRVLNISNPAQITKNSPFETLWAAEDFQSYFGVPLISKSEIKGVLEVFHRSPLPSKPEWLEFLETLAGQAAIAIDETQLFDNLQKVNLELALAYDATIEGWSRAMDMRDQETEGHTQRVTKIAMKLAKEIGMNDKEIVDLRRGALLHDIGKMGVPDHILLKSGTLTDGEWVIMHKHPQLAFEMLKPINYLRQSIDIPYCHHEKWDGTGYPRGLKGEQIPLAARIFAVVDVWDALRSDRPYRPGWTEEKVLDYIRAETGKHFDPEVINTFLNLIAEK